MGNDKAKSDTRADRLAQALRANLRRRKAQGRARTVEEPTPEGKTEAAPATASASSPNNEQPE
jgi:hypothetical protein